MAGKVECDCCGSNAGPSKAMVALVWKADRLLPGQTHGGLPVDALFCDESCLFSWMQDRWHGK